MVEACRPEQAGCCQGRCTTCLTSGSQVHMLIRVLAGIVHRDVKPQNCIISDEDKKVGGSWRKAGLSWQRLDRQTAGRWTVRERVPDGCAPSLCT